MRRGLATGAVAACLAVPATAEATTVYTPPPSPTAVAIDGTCSIREAIAASNNDLAGPDCPAGTDADQINLAPGTYSLMGGHLDIGDPTPGERTVIQGSTAGSSIIANAPGSFNRVIFVQPNTSGLGMSDVTVTGGRLNVAAIGGGISVGSNTSLFLMNSTVTDNEVGSSVNNTEGDGGGIGAANNAGTVVTLQNVTVSGNRASRDGGGIDLQGAGLVTITLSTIAGNIADTNSAVMGGAGGDGGGLSRSGGTLNFGGNIVAGNTDSSGQAPDCKGFNFAGVTNFGGSVIGSTTGCNFTSGPADVIGDPLLGPLASNGGPTQTHAIPANSPAVDRVPAFCQAPFVDQRGVSRPQGVRCDAGAYEFAPPPATPSGPGTQPVTQPLTGPSAAPAKCKKKKTKKKGRASAAAKKCKKAKKKKKR